MSSRFYSSPAWRGVPGPRTTRYYLYQDCKFRWLFGKVGRAGGREGHESSDLLGRGSGSGCLCHQWAGSQMGGWAQNHSSAIVVIWWFVMTFLTSFYLSSSADKLCHGSLLPLCLIRSSSSAQWFLEEESEAQVTQWFSPWLGVFSLCSSSPGGTSQCSVFAKIPTCIENQQTPSVEAGDLIVSHWHSLTPVERSALRVPLCTAPFQALGYSLSLSWRSSQTSQETGKHSFCNKIWMGDS